MAAPKAAALPLATLADIIAIDDTSSQGVIVEVPEWKLSVKVRGMTRGEVQTLTEKEGLAREAFILSSGVVDPKMTEDEALELVTGKGFSATQRVLDRILEVSGLAAGFRSDETA